MRSSANSLLPATRSHHKQTIKGCHGHTIRETALQCTQLSHCGSPPSMNAVMDVGRPYASCKKQQFMRQKVHRDV